MCSVITADGVDTAEVRVLLPCTAGLQVHGAGGPRAWPDMGEQQVRPPAWLQGSRDAAEQDSMRPAPGTASASSLKKPRPLLRRPGSGSWTDPWHHLNAQGTAQKEEREKSPMPKRRIRDCFTELCGAEPRKAGVNVGPSLPLDGFLLLTDPSLQARSLSVPLPLCLSVSLSVSLSCSLSDTHTHTHSSLSIERGCPLLGSQAPAPHFY